jgi:hypothetical protein
MVRRYGLVALLVFASIVTLSACGKPKAGGKCQAGTMACNDAKTGLFCGSDGTFQTMTCGGTGGCQTAGAKVTCDQSVAAAGDGCTAAGFACASDMKNALSCTDGKFVLAETCKGPGACKVATGDIFCDNDIADVGDPCRDDGDYACTGDKLAALKCQGKKMVTINSCRGPKSCSIVHPKPKETDIDCDMSVAAENDPCAFPNNEACTSDKKTMLTCKGNKYSTPTPCPGPNGCTVTANAKTFKVTCDTAAAADNGGKGGGGKKGKKH